MYRINTRRVYTTKLPILNKIEIDIIIAQLSDAKLIYLHIRILIRLVCTKYDRDSNQQIHIYSTLTGSLFCSLWIDINRKVCGINISNPLSDLSENYFDAAIDASIIGFGVVTRCQMNLN